MINHDNSLNSTIVISCRKEGNRTRLADSFFTMPYKLSHYGRPNASKHLEVIQMSAGPGFMDGDSLDMKVSCDDETEMKLFSQSYNKIHPMPRKLGARQDVQISLGRNTLFQYIPHPIIPYEDSIFNAVNRIEMAGDAHLIWADIISGGRIHSGERFKLASYRTQTRIFRDRKLVLFDNQVIEPRNQPVEDVLFFEGYTHQATLVVLSPYAESLKMELDELLIDQVPEMTYGFTRCAPDGLMLRAMANSGDVLHEWFTNVANMSWDFISHHRKTAAATEPQAAAAEAKQAIAERPEPPAKKSVSKRKSATTKPLASIQS